MIRFYTLPPRTRPWPYLMASIKYRSELFLRRFDHGILDPGVEIFQKAPEYPRGFKSRWISIATWTHERTKGRTWITIPDYPDDYTPGLTGDNVGRTLDNIRWFMAKDPDLPWLPVLQARYLNPFSFFESCQETKQLLGDYPRIAIGTVCKTGKLEFIEYCCRVARELFPRSWIHAFGLTLHGIPRVKDLIDSFDSSAWSFPRTSFSRWSEETGLRPLPNAHWNTRKGEPWFDAYINRLQEIVHSRL